MEDLNQAVDGEGSMDRISQLPQPLLHHILCFLSQKNAIKTCALSKTWLQIGSTRPNIEFRKRYFPDDETFLSVLQTTLQRYQHQNLSVKELRLEMPGIDSESISFLEKWVPAVMLNMGLNTFDLSFSSLENADYFDLPKAYFDLPSAVFQSETLQKLSLFRCKLSQITPLDNVILFKRLKTLSLKEVYVWDKTLDMILSRCRLIETLVLHRCEGLGTIKLIKSHNNLKLFDFREHPRLQYEDNSIEINAPTLEKVKISGCPNWVNLDRYLFPYLKSLYLDEVRLPSKTLNIFSCIFPCLEVLGLADCYDCEELHISSHSIKNLIIAYTHSSPKAVIDAPSLVGFEYEGDLNIFISFKATASEWKSTISLNLIEFDFSSWCLLLHEMMKAFSKSQISLDIYLDLTGTEDTQEEEEEEEDDLILPADTFGGVAEPFEVKLLHLSLYGLTQYYSWRFIITLLHICRPRNIHQFWYRNFDTEDDYECHNQVTTMLRNILLLKIEMMLSWEKDLVQTDLEEVYDNEYRDEVHFQLKWRD